MKPGTSSPWMTAASTNANAATAPAGPYSSGGTHAVRAEVERLRGEEGKQPSTLGIGAMKPAHARRTIEPRTGRLTIGGHGSWGIGQTREIATKSRTGGLS